MGGYGSGKWDRWDTKTTVEECQRLDVRKLAREGCLTPGQVVSWAWWRGEQKVSTITICVAADSVTLRYRSRSNDGKWEDVDYSVRLEWTPCHYGGRRAWFRCPGVVNGRHCGQRVAILYDGGKYFLCRRCYDLTYQSQREDAGDRAMSKAHAIRRRLGGSANALEPFPDKPKGMHWRTYDRLARDWYRAEMIYGAAMDAQLLALSAWMDKKYP